MKKSNKSVKIKYERNSDNYFFYYFGNQKQ